MQGNFTDQRLVVFEPAGQAAARNQNEEKNT
jgi:hypothetical protein